MVLAALLVLATAGCAGGVEDRSLAEIDANEGGSSLDLDHPLGPLGQEVEDAVTAGLPFVPVLPQKERSNVTEFIYTPGDPSAAIAAFVYDDETWGRFLMLQYSDTQTQEGLLAEEASQEGGGCSPVPEHGEGAVACTFAPHDVVELDSDTAALIAAGKDRTSLTWVAELQPASGFGLDDFKPNTSLTIEIQGDPAVFSKAQAIAFGESAAKAESSPQPET
jgi:hypothetical protein